jgi:hypothetical protein
MKFFQLLFAPVRIAKVVMISLAGVINRKGRNSWCVVTTEARMLTGSDCKPECWQVVSGKMNSTLGERLVFSY